MSVLEFKRPLPKPPAAKPRDDGSQHLCKRCDGGEFRLSWAGMVHCCQCGALMKNLLVSLTDGRSGR